MLKFGATHHSYQTNFHNHTINIYIICMYKFKYIYGSRTFPTWILHPPPTLDIPHNDSTLWTLPPRTWPTQTLPTWTLPTPPGHYPLGHYPPGHYPSNIFYHDYWIHFVEKKKLTFYILHPTKIHKKGKLLSVEIFKFWKLDHY